MLKNFFENIKFKNFGAIQKKTENEITLFSTSGIITHLLNWLNIKFGPKIPIFLGFMAKNEKKIMSKKWPFWGHFFLKIVNLALKDTFLGLHTLLYT